MLVASPRFRRAALLATVLVLLGFAIRDRLEPAARAAGAPAPAAPVSDLTIQQLQALGYVSGVEAMPEKRGVLVYDRARAASGHNLVTSAHGEEALLLDMDGRVVHRWAYPSGSELFPIEARDEETAEADAQGRKWRKLHVYPNGDLLVMHSGRGIFKLDRDSKLLWHRRAPHHHDLTVAADGDVYTLTRADRVVPELNANIDVGDDLITVLSADGSLRRELSILSALEASEFAHLWRASSTFGDAPSWNASVELGKRELFHTNAIVVLDGRIAHRIPEFRRGNVLVSLSRIDVIAVVDAERERVVWARRLGFRRQHDPTITDSGTLMLFDNQGLATRSRVWEIDPLTDALKWSYGDAPDQEIYSGCCSTAQRLANGNTLITETDAGRALEVTRDGAIVWEYVSGHPSLDDPQKVARVFEVERMPPGFGEDWLPPRT